MTYWTCGNAVGFDKIKLFTGQIFLSKVVLTPGFKYSVCVEDGKVAGAWFYTGKLIRVKCEKKDGRMYIPAINSYVDRKLECAGGMVDLPEEIVLQCRDSEILDADAEGKVFKFIRDEEEVT